MKLELDTFAAALAIGLTLVVIVDLLRRRHNKDIVQDIIIDVAILALLMASIVWLRWQGHHLLTPWLK